MFYILKGKIILTMHAVFLPSLPVTFHIICSRLAVHPSDRPFSSIRPAHICLVEGHFAPYLQLSAKSSIGLKCPSSIGKRKQTRKFHVRPWPKSLYVSWLFERGDFCVLSSCFCHMCVSSGHLRVCAPYQSTWEQPQTEDLRQASKDIDRDYGATGWSV